MLLPLQRRQLPRFYNKLKKTTPSQTIMADWVPAVAFALTSIVSTFRLRRRRLNSDSTMLRHATTDATTIRNSKETVQQQRTKHFMKCVSISYANSGGLMIVRGKGSRLMDATGKSYLDTRNNVCHVGHCHPRVVEAVSKQLATLNTNTRYLHPNVCQLAERLCAKCPDPLEVVAFVNSGSVR